MRSLIGYITDRPETLTVADMVPLYGYYFHGGYYPEGGSGRLAAVLADVVRRRGGSVRLRSPVRRILVERGRAAGIELASGERLEAAAVVSNADYKRSFLELVDAVHLDSAFRDTVERTKPASSRRAQLFVCTWPSTSCQTSGRFRTSSRPRVVAWRWCCRP
jgi:phytoene dehydrogenase-like protein